MTVPARKKPARKGAPVVVRPAVIEDAAILVKLIRQLADYELAPNEVQLQVSDLEAALFGPGAKVFAHVAEIDGVIVGAAIWFLNFSTWTGRHGIYLEDLFVVPQARGHGAGRALLTELARMAVARGYTRVEWAVLDWNEPAADFYRHLGARAQDGWVVFRLAGADLAELGRG
jgi:GNAT superfamily N-acetyltransferase